MAVSIMRLVPCQIYAVPELMKIQSAPRKPGNKEWSVRDNIVNSTRLLVPSKERTNKCNFYKIICILYLTSWRVRLNNGQLSGVLHFNGSYLFIDHWHNDVRHNHMQIICIAYYCSLPVLVGFQSSTKRYVERWVLQMQQGVIWKWTLYLVENIKARRDWPLWWEFTGDRWSPLTKGQ